MAVNYIVVGKKCTKTKKNNNFYTYYLIRPFDSYEKEHSVCTVGEAVEQISCFSDFPVQQGDAVELIYSRGFQDKAILSDMRIVKPDK